MSSAEAVLPARASRWGVRGPELMLALAAALWGLTFLGTKLTLAYGGALELVGCRFAIAAALLALLSLRRLAGFTWLEWKAGVFVAFPMAIGYVLQTEALITIESGKSAFLTALYVILVPLMQMALLRRAPNYRIWIGVTLAFAGLVLMSGVSGTSGSFGRGELLTLLATLAISIEILVVGIYAPRVDPRRFAIVQMALVGLFCFLAMPLGNAATALPVTGLLFGAGLLGLASAVIQVGVNWAQRTVSQGRAAIIYATEPLWAAAAGSAHGERIGASALTGAGLILAGILASSFAPVRQPGGAVTPDSERIDP